MSAVPAVKHPGGGFVDDFGETVGVGGKLGVSLVDREVVGIEEFISETESVGGLGGGDDGLGNTVGAAGFEDVVSRVGINPPDFDVGVTVTARDRGHVHDARVGGAVAGRVG